MSIELTHLFILFLKGIFIGFVVALPVGPVGILCIRRTVSGRYDLAMLTGLGAGLADTFYGAVAGLSLAGIADFITHHDFYLRLFGGLLVAWIGFTILKAPLRETKELGEDQNTSFRAFSSGFFLTISNPIALLVFAGAFAAIGAGPLNDSLSQALALVGGVFFGANAWWLSLVIAIQMMHHKLSDTQLHWINRSSGVILIGFSAYILLSLL